MTAVDSELLLTGTGEVEKWTLIPSHYKLLSSFVTVTIFQGERLLETAADRQKHIYFSLPGHKDSNTKALKTELTEIIKDSKSSVHVRPVVACLAQSLWTQRYISDSQCDTLIYTRTTTDGIEL